MPALVLSSHAVFVGTLTAPAPRLALVYCHHQPLHTCTHPKVLWLSHNPVAENPDYRASVIRLLPHLIKLDDKDVTADELVQAKKSGVVIPAKDVDDEAEAELAEANNADNVRGSGGEVEGDADAEVGAGEAALTAIKALLPLLSPKQLAEVSSAIALQQ